MMILGFAMIGAALGLRNVRKREGSRADYWQYGAVGALIGALIGLLGSILIANL